MNINIKYLSDKIEQLKNIEGVKSDWVDLRCAEDVILKKGDFRLLPLGVAIALPEGYEAILAPRSSTFKNFGILQTNGIGVIDESYCGDGDQWMMPVLATRDTEINVNDRICQFRVFKHQPDIQFNAVESLGNKDRGGFGSTGR